MIFSEFASGIYPFCSLGLKEDVFFTELIGNYIKDGTMDACSILKRKPDTKRRYIKGDRSITLKDAKFLYEHKDVAKFSAWIADQTEESDSYNDLLNWLHSKNIDVTDPDDGCANLLTQIFLEIIHGKKESLRKETNSTAVLLEQITEITNKIKQFPKPDSVPVPPKATENERTYIHELCLAYGDAENIANFTEKNLLDYPEYDDDLRDRRTDFYSALSVQRGISELDNALSNQFSILKQEVLDGVKDTVRRRSYPDGYERMLATMEQASQLPVTNYILSSSPYWIGASIKKGVCHHLVNDKKIRWVKKKIE